LQSGRRRDRSIRTGGAVRRASAFGLIVTLVMAAAVAGLDLARAAESDDDDPDAASALPNLYLDLNSYLKSYLENDVPWTPAVTLVRGLYVALDMIQKEGIENVWKRTSAYAAATRAAANALGLGVFSKQPSDSVTGINYPAGFTDKEFRGALRKQLNMNVAAGQGSMEGKMFRISHMGYVDQADTLGVIHGVEIILKQQGYKFEFGAGVAAAHKELAKLQDK